MDLGSENLDYKKLINVKGNIENITPHKIAVVAFIREYGLLKIEGKCLHVFVVYYLSRINLNFLFTMVAILLFHRNCIYSYKYLIIVYFFAMFQQAK